MFNLVTHIDEMVQYTKAHLIPQNMQCCNVMFLISQKENKSPLRNAEL
jgi:hypothetical protein